MDFHVFQLHRTFKYKMYVENISPGATLILRGEGIEGGGGGEGGILMGGGG